MPSEVLLSLACNDYRNGNFASRFESLDCCDCQLTGRPMRCAIGTGSFRIGRHEWPHKGMIEWYGNWCWNAFRVTPQVAAEAMNYATERGYVFESCREEFFECADGKPVSAEHIERYLNAEAERLPPC